MNMSLASNVGHPGNERELGQGDVVHELDLTDDRGPPSDFKGLPLTLDLDEIVGGPLDPGTDVRQGPLPILHLILQVVMDLKKNKLA